MNIETPCIINRNEQNSRVLNFKIPVELVDKNVSMAFITPNRVRRSTGLLTVAADGSGSYTLTAEVLDGVGTLAAQLNITDGEGTFVQKSTVYLFTVGRDISEEYAVIGTSTYTIADLIAMFGDYVPKPSTDVESGLLMTSAGDGEVEWLPLTDDVVKYSEQTKTDEEKAQARANIDAVNETDIAEAVEGLASETFVNTAVGNLDNSLSSVAKSGSYDDLSDTPTALSDFTNDEEFVNREFVNSSIATNTANFIGTFNSVAELEAYAGTKTNNDYAFVIIYDSVITTQVKQYDRYKYVAASEDWTYEYTLNNSSFTAEQWAAIQSGINASKVTQIETNRQAIETKQTKPTLRTVTLTAADWDSTELTQTVTVTGVTATNDIDVASAPSNFEEYGKAGIYAVTQATDSVTFKCKKVPENNITVYVRIWEG